MAESSTTASQGNAGSDDPRRRYHSLTVSRIIQETADASSIVFEIPEALTPAFTYLPGQFLTLQVVHEGKKLFRCYSLASSPLTDPEHKVTVKRVENGRVSNWVGDHLREGDQVLVLPPTGDFVLGEEDTGELILFSGGSGITPVISIIKTALARGKQNIRLLYANRDEDSIIFKQELEDLAAQSGGRFDLVHRLDSRDGFVDAEAVTAHCNGTLDATFFMCGPTPFMDTVEAALLAQGVDASAIKIERFSSPPDGEELSAGEAAEADAAGSRARIHLDGQAHDVAIREGETVLQAGKRCGADPPYSCESGFCGCCMARLKRGKVEMKLNDFLQADEVEEGWILTCQAVPKTADIEIEYPD